MKVRELQKALDVVDGERADAALLCDLAQLHQAVLGRHAHELGGVAVE